MKTLEELGQIILDEIGADSCLDAYHTADPRMVGYMAVGYGDINTDGTWN